MWCVAELDRNYIERMEEVLAVYEKPYQVEEPVVCLDEKPISLHADVRPPRPMVPGKPSRPDNEYKRCGTANVSGIVEPKAGRHFTTATFNRSADQFAHVLRHVVAQYPEADTIHLFMDNLNIHCQKSLVDSFGQQKDCSSENQSMRIIEKQQEALDSQRKKREKRMFNASLFSLR